MATGDRDGRQKPIPVGRSVLLEDQLSEDERMIRDTARAYAQEKLQPRVIEAYREETTTRRSSARWATSACSA